MRLNTARAALLSALLLCAAPAAGQDAPGARPKRPRTPEDYKPRRLKELASPARGAESRGDKRETVVVEADIMPSRVSARYVGKSRPMPERKREALRQWARLYAGFPEGLAGPYRTELLFTEDGPEYWLAVRSNDLTNFEEAVKLGDEFELSLIRVGAARVAEAWEPVLLIESSALLIHKTASGSRPPRANHHDPAIRR
jgi:hypothetical protein